MSKILLIEDRVSRQDEYLSKFNIDLDSFDILTNIKGGREFNEIKKALSDTNTSKFDPFISIIAHRSALDHSERAFLYNFCKSKQKPLTFFSGGISSITYSDNDHFNFLSINVSDFYGENLLLFIKEASVGNVKLAYLAFGKKWKLNLLLNYTRLLNGMLYDNEMAKEYLPSQIFKSKINLYDLILVDLLNEYNIFPNYPDGTMVRNPKEQIITLIADLKEILTLETLLL